MVQGGKSASKDEFVYFIGGSSGYYISSKIEVYNTSTQSWMPSVYMTEPRCLATAVASDSALYIAGGIVTWSSPLNIRTNTVDIYADGVLNTYYLPDSISGASSLAAGKKIFIAGGSTYCQTTHGLSTTMSNKVFIFDEASKIWSVDTLSEARSLMGAATDGSLVIFAGGWSSSNQPSKRVDIYNITTNSWAIDSLSEARDCLSGVYAGGKFFFAGGFKSGDISSDVVDIFDGSTWSTAQLSKPRGGVVAATTNNIIFFTGGGSLDNIGNYSETYDIVDVYDVTLDLWSTTNMWYNKANHTAVASGNTIYVAGGVQMPQPTFLNVVEFYDLTAGIEALQNNSFKPKVFPNPASNKIYLSGLSNTASISHAEIFTAAGARVATVNDMHHGTDISGLAPGLYCLRVHHDRGVSVVKFVKE